MKTFALMFVTFIFVETVSADLFLPTPQPFECGEKEVFVRCSNKANNCEPSCAVPVPKICTMKCAPGCDCQPGYLRSKNGKCVLPNQCEK